MAVTPGTADRWETLYAARTRGEVGEGIAAVLGLLGVPNVISFAGGFPDPATFPRERVSALLGEFVATGEATAFQYAPTRGLAGALAAFADRIETLQGRRPAERQCVITSGAIEALELVGKSFLDAGDIVVVEGPTYLGAIQSFRSFEATIEAVPLDGDGLQVDELERRLARGLRPKLVYAIPDHQNPAGVTLSAERRTALVELARTHGFLVVEDVAYRELGFAGQALPSLWSLAPDVVVQAGTIRRPCFPACDSVGLSLLRTSQHGSSRPSRPPTSARVRSASASSKVPPSWLDRRAARGVARALRAKVRTAARGVEASMPASARWTTPHGGFFSWLTLPSVDATELAQRAVERSVGIVPGSLFFPDGRGADSVRLSFSLVDESQVAEGIARLAALL